MIFDFGHHVEGVLGGIVDVFKIQGVGGTLAVGILGLSGAILVLTLLWFFPARWRIARARLAVALASGADVHTRRDAFARNFDVISGRLSDIKRIGPTWLEFEETLIRPDDGNAEAFGSRNVRNVRRPDEFISLRATGMSGDLVRSFPGVIIGLGLVLTFVGLIAALTIAAGNLDEGMSPTQMRDVLSELLRTAGAKFYASATALACSIALGLFQRALLASLVRSLRALNHALEDRLQYDATALSRVEQLRVMGEQNDQMRQLAADIAFQIGERVAEKVSPINSALGETLEAVASKLDRIADQTGSSIASTLGDRFEQALAETLSQLDGTLQTVRAELTSLPQQLDAAVGAMDTAAGALSQRFGEAADKSAERANAELEAGLAPIIEALANAARTIEAAGGAVRRGADQAVEAVTDRFGAAGHGFEEAATNAGAALARESEAAAGRFAAAVAPVEAAGTEIARASVAIAEGAQTMVRAAERLGDSLSESASAHQSIASLVSEATKAAEETNERHDTLLKRSVAAAERLDHSGTVVGDAVKALQASADALVGRADLIATETGQTAERIAITLTAAREALSEHVARYDGLDDQFASAFKEFEEAISSQQRNLTAHVQEIDRAFASAIVELHELVDDLSGLNRTPSSQVRGAST